jgi:peptide/nickel transport system ATP-binding protein
VKDPAVKASLLQVERLSTVLDTDAGLLRAVDALSLTIERGETFALVGESGCGKSMTALSILRLLPDNGRVAEGRIELGGTDVAQLPEARMRDVRGRRIGIVFQEPATSLNPVLPVGAQVVEVIERHTPLKGAAARAKALDWLTRVGLPEPERRIDAYSFQLSGGQKQRVMIAIALAAEPDVLIADEPTTALDVTVQQQILQLLAGLQRSQGMAMLLITHDLGIVAQVAHRIALMYAGQVVEVAGTATFFARPLHPYAQMLLDALPDTARRGEPLAAIAGSVPRLDQAFDRCRFADRCPAVHEACLAGEPLLVRPVEGRAVRCVLYRDGLSAVRVPTRPAAGGRPEAAAAAAPAPLLEVRDYRVLFPIRRGVLKRTIGHVKAVDGVSFTLQSGRTLALVGESGCGKTTTGKALVQLLRGVAEIRGDALLEGRSLAALEGDELREARRTLQIIFQDPFASLNPRMRVAELLEEGLIALRPEVDAAERQARIGALLAKVGLPPEAVDRYPHEFSGGQRQRLAIARALAVEPQLIVCDEPTSALDVSVQAQILNLLRQLQRDLGVAYLFITHNFGVVEYLAHDIAVMKDGRIVEAGPAERLLAAPEHPYTRALLAAVPRVTRAA